MIDNYNFETIKESQLAFISAGKSENISKNIRQLRTEAGFKRKELADMLMISLSTIAKYEEGTRVPDIDMIIDLAEILNTDVNHLIY